MSFSILPREMICNILQYTKEGARVCREFNEVLQEVLEPYVAQLRVAASNRFALIIGSVNAETSSTEVINRLYHGIHGDHIPQLRSAFKASLASSPKVFHDSLIQFYVSILEQLDKITILNLYYYIVLEDLVSVSAVNAALTRKWNLSQEQFTLWFTGARPIPGHHLVEMIIYLQDHLEAFIQADPDNPEFFSKLFNDFSVHGKKLFPNHDRYILQAVLH